MREDEVAKEYEASRTQCTLPSSSWTEGRGAGRENDFRFSARKIVGQSRGANRDRHLSANWGHRGILIDPFLGSEIERPMIASMVTRILSRDRWKCDFFNRNRRLAKLTNFWKFLKLFKINENLMIVNFKVWFLNLKKLNLKMLAAILGIFQNLFFKYDF